MNNLTTENEQFLSEVNNYKNDYYSNNRKGMIFKKTQKLDLAKNISKQFDLKTLITNSIFIIPNSNNIYLDYTILKLYIHPDNYNSLFDYILYLQDELILKYKTYNIHINLDTFTISAAERYKSLIELYVKKCEELSVNKPDDELYTSLVDKLCIYNTPHIIDTIIMLLKPVIPPIINTKFHFETKQDSPDLIKKLLEQKHI